MVSFEAAHKKVQEPRTVREFEDAGEEHLTFYVPFPHLKVIPPQKITVKTLTPILIFRQGHSISLNGEEPSLLPLN